MRAFRNLLIACLVWLPIQAWSALDPAIVKQLASDSSDDRVAAIGQLGLSADPLAVKLLKEVVEGNAYALEDGRVLIVDGDKAVDAATGADVAPVPENKDQIVVNNRLRKALESAQAGGKLFSPDRDVRLAAARDLQTNAGASQLPDGFGGLGTNRVADGDDPEHHAFACAMWPVAHDDGSLCTLFDFRYTLLRGR